VWFTEVPRIMRNAQITAAAYALALCVAVLFGLSGLAGGIESQLRDARDTLRIAPATGDIVIAEIDGRSLQALPQWPWPRRLYADAITQLDQLGAAQIAFDVEFSARSNPAEDAQFAAALAAIGQPTILPTFRQENLAGESVTISESLPMEDFRENAFLASVNVRAAPDGQIKQYFNGETTNGVPRPSLANMLARAGGEVDQTFRIDQAINPVTVPRISFIDLIEGRVSRSQVEGKQVVFGNTAIELGDRYPTALFGVQPGVLVHVQAAETLIQSRARMDAYSPTVLGLLAALLGAILVVRARRAWQSKWLRPVSLATFVTGIYVTAALALDQASMAYLPLGAPLVFLGSFILTHRALVMIASLQIERLTNTASGLPNARSMGGMLRRTARARVAAARIADFAELTAMLSVEQQGNLDRALARRLGMMSQVGEVFWIETGVFAWIMPEDFAGDDMELLEEAFATARALFNTPVEVESERLRINLHFGTAIDSIERALDASELARKRSLNWSANAEALLEETQYRQRLLGELDEALTDGSIFVVFQPKLAMASAKIRGGECLVRWDSARLGRISPADFIPILEEKGRVHDLTLFVVQEAMDRQREAAAQGHAINLAVNVSAQLLGDVKFVDALVAKFDVFGRPEKGGITLEITESAPLQDSESARIALTRMRETGARISIDDYGTGQATLNYLQDFPAQEIKLDQSFIRDLVEDRKDQIMVQSTIDLAHALGFEIVAEGVETQAILDALAALGCDYAQGWHIGKPMEWDEFARVLGADAPPVQIGATARAA